MTKILGPEFSYISALDMALLEKYQDESKVRLYNPLRPSSAGKCELALAHEYHQFHGLEPVFIEERDPSVIRLLSLGHSVEWHVINQLKEIEKMFGLSAKYKQQSVSILTLDDGTIIEGNLDLCLVGPDSKGIVDVKSSKERFSKAYGSSVDDLVEKFDNFSSLVKIDKYGWYAENAVALVDELGDDFKVANILQLNLYALSDFIKERNFDHCSLLYYFKNSSRMLELRFKPSEELKERVRQKFNRVHNSLGKLETIEPGCFIGSFQYMFCPYCPRRYGDDNPKKAFYKNQPKKTWPVDSYAIPESREIIESKFEEFIKLQKAGEKKEELERSIARLLYDQQIQKIRLPTGEIYEMKLLKSPKEHFELRRSKL